MRKTIIALVVSGLSALALVAPGAAQADSEISCSGDTGKITCTAQGNWHINKDYPWAATAGSTKMDKSKFSLGEKSASVSVPAGQVKVKGAVCSGDQCHKFETSVTVK
jgi:hypothetical protein